MNVQSEPGIGSRFGFTLTMGRCANPDLVPSAVSRELDACRVLVVDDNPSAREILTGALHRYEPHVRAVASAAAAMEEIYAADDKGEGYEVVLADFGMPEKNGLELAAAIAEADLRLVPKVILVTAFRREDVMRAAEAAPLAAVLYKPINQSQLHDTLAKVLAKDGGQRKAVVSKRRMPRFEGRKVLLVEDNEINQQIAKELLLFTGMELDIADNGRIALEMLFGAEPGEYDLVVMDLEMPELGGHATARRIRMDHRFAEMPIVAMTAHAAAEVREDCLHSGMQDHLAKPINPDELYRTLARWMKASQAPEASGPAVEEEPASDAIAQDDYADLAAAGFAIAETLDRLGGDTELFRDILGMVPRVTGESMGKFDATLAAGDLEGAAAAAHALRGMASTVGATPLTESAEAVERGMREGGASTAQIEIFRRSTEAARRAVEQFLAG
jgi:CheY-like chemotaxis protein/HPt (histidine-containing phosphotransfer) domain-containing protein